MSTINALHRRRYDDGYSAAVGTWRGSFINPGQAVSAKDYGNTAPDRHADTYWWLRGWNDAVEHITADAEAMP